MVNPKAFFLLLFVFLAGASLLFLVRKRQVETSKNHNDELPPEIIEKANQDRAEREKVRQENPALFEAVTAAMFRRDPIGINFGENTDEYEAEAGTVIPRLKDCQSEEDVCAVLHEEFIRWFGQSTAGEKSRYSALASDIWKLWNESKTTPGDEPNSTPYR